MTKTGEAARPPMELDADSFLDTIRLKAREIAVSVVVVAAVAAAVYLWRESTIRKDERAERALQTAGSSYYSGNKTLAQSDLEKMGDRYSGTSAGVQGTMLLAQILFENGKWDDGIKKLESVKGSSAAGRFGAPIEGLIAGAYADQKKYDEAAQHFLAASGKAAFSADKDLYRAEAARALALGGKPDGAKKIWAELATKLDSPALGEAKIRLGELQAGGAAKP